MVRRVGALCVTRGSLFHDPHFEVFAASGMLGGTMRCPKCSAEVPGGTSRCPKCGDVLPMEAPKDAPEATTAYDRGSSVAAEPRFLPGVVLGQRYRIVNLLGRGGMGEVYRADDLKLGQSVALKFLPSEFSEDRSRLDLLLTEVRLARSISHANVCRVYDIGEIDGQHFISMELVDGEDLASLLRRIDRLPEEKALQTARQLCAGLAAAHAEGILHRDLKPANVMLDGRGRAKIMDFGLAVLEEPRADEVRAGTPAYMAPEQRSGDKLTVRSDLYSLGLVLYELFTGRRARQHERSSDPVLQTPSSLVEGLDPAVESTILSCIEEDPALRPVSALAVAAALPGGDPLAAALMAGETPAPADVAAAGGKGALNPKIAVLCCVASLALLIAMPFLHQRTSLIGLSPVPHPPAVLIAMAREMVEEIGYSEPGVDEAYLFFTDWDLLEHVRATNRSLDRWAGLATDRPTPVGFWYRQSPTDLVPWFSPTHVRFRDPPVQTPGMINVELESTGELRSLWVVPPAELEMPESAVEPDWSLLFELAGLDRELFVPVAPELTPRIYCDVQAAWEGRYAGQSEPEIRLEACALGGRMVEFRTVHPWSDPRGVQSSSPGVLAGRVAFYLLFVGLAICAVVMARRNLRMGRGDRRGAVRVAAFVVITTMIAWTLTFNHVSAVGSELLKFFMSLGFALFLGFTLWLFYIAMEPPVRRFWPELLISWSRVMAGRFRDPLVGSHLLLGSLLGLGGGAVVYLSDLAARKLSHPSPPPVDMVPEQIHSPGWFLGEAIRSLGQDILWPTIMSLFLLVFLYFVLRRRWLAILCFVAVPVAFEIFSTASPISLLPLWLLSSGLLALAYVRLGLVGALAANAMLDLPESFLLTSDSSAWYFGYSLTTIIVCASFILYSFWVSLGGQSVFGDPQPSSGTDS